MTIAAVPCVAAAFLLVGSVLARRAPDPRSARAAAAGCVTVTALGVAVTMVVARWTGWPDGHRVGLLAPGSGWWMPFVTCLAGLAATALAPITPPRTIPSLAAGLPAVAARPDARSVASHDQATFARILLVLAGGTAATAVAGPPGAAGPPGVAGPTAAVISWALSAFVVWRELRERAPGRGPTRLFALHHLVGVGACAAGLLLADRLGGTVAALLLAVGVGVRQCLLPLHLWYEPFARTAPAGLVVAFAAGPAGVLLLPEVGRAVPDHGWVVAVAAASALLGAGLGLVARDVRSALAQIGLALSGVLSCGILIGSEPARSGAVLSWQVGAVAAGGAMMIAAATEARRGPMLLTGPGGCFARTPRLAVAFLLFGLTSIGFPATLGFVWEDLLLDGVGGWSVPAAGALVLAVAGAGATVMKWYFAGYTGRRDHVGEQDLTPRESNAVTVLLAALILGELAPALLLP
ncbi:proton-conducting transporter transmembrane domain-containing protein [Parafrankia discariae]|uniref:proton-conducting transporter transmembrane domain-containing protein n=1 Tax=Parafrankia discariae TaxID=365528 RepID=UPI000365352F|nr:proton-conducting transporter membrane subunit [Parafrankia discariae]